MSEFGLSDEQVMEEVHIAGIGVERVVTIFGTNQAGNFLNIGQCWGDKSVTEISLRPGKIVSNFDHLYPDAYKHLDEFLDKRNEMRDGADWCSSLAGRT